VVEPLGERKIKVMGLDMYLFLRKREYHSGSAWRPEAEKKLAKYPKELEAFEEEIKQVNFPSVSIDTDYQIGYWRKANAIHEWFVQNCADGVDECQDTYVSIEKAQELLNTCNKVLADHSLAESALPTQEGFFFGSQEYDNWYYEDVAYTKDLLEKILNFLKTTEGKCYRIVYCASW